MLLSLINEILRGFDEDQCTIIMFLDLSAAFDTIDIELLISILRDEIGVSGFALSWITSFLTGRTQNVRIGSCYSDNHNVDCGMPQGSILGPQFFNVYILPQPKAFLQCGYKSCSFADDSSGRKRFSLIFQYSILKHSIASCMDNVKKWMNVHKLKINTDKTEITLFPS